MARTRNYKQEYARRVALGRARGETRQQARGHRTTPERPERAFRAPERFPDYLDRLNDRRALKNKAPLQIGRPPDPDRTRRQGTTDSLEEAERRTEGAPLGYKSIFVWGGQFTWQV